MELQHIEPNFWNIHAPLPMLGGMVDIKTHMSLIKLSTGKFLVVDTIALTPTVKQKVDELTDGGKLISAVIATHPFHTLYFKPFYDTYPNAEYYGLDRHLRMITTIPWKGNLLQNDRMKLWESEGIFMSVPDGAELEYPGHDDIHFSCVFVFHQPSKTIHEDDTIIYFEGVGCVLGLLGKRNGGMEFWMLKGLRRDAEAPMQFKAWVEKIMNDWEFDNICAAHTSNCMGNAKTKLKDALAAAMPELEALTKKYKK